MRTLEMESDLVVWVVPGTVCVPCLRLPFIRQNGACCLQVGYGLDSHEMGFVA